MTRHPASWLARLYRNGGVLFGLWCASALIDLSVGLGFGPSAPTIYYLLYLSLGALATTAIGVASCALPSGLMFAVVVWVGANTWYESGLILAAALSAAALAWIRLVASSDQIPWRVGTRGGLALATAICVWPEFLRRIHSHWLGHELVNGIITVSLFLAIAGLIGFLARRPVFTPTVETLLTAFLVLAPLGGGLILERLVMRDYPPDYPTHAKDQRKQNIIMLVLDTVRADSMSVYGYKRPTTPRIQEFVSRSDRAIVYPYAFAPGNWTLPSHASLFTGLLPSEHGSHVRSVYDESDGPPKHIQMRAKQTLAELLRQSGYFTGAIVANGMLFIDLGMKRGFDWWYKPRSVSRPRLFGEHLRSIVFSQVFNYVVKPYPTADRINTSIIAFIDACRGAPFFVFGNYMEAHWPYAARPPHRGMFTRRVSGSSPDRVPMHTDSSQMLAHFKARYDEEIHVLDAEIYQLLKQLEKRDLLDTTWIIITSDHGESFGEHGVTEHSTSLYNEQTWIPLIIHPPKGVVLEIPEYAISLLDVTATLSHIGSGTHLGIGQDLRHLEAVPAPVKMEFFGDPRSRIRARSGELAGLAARSVIVRYQKLIDYGSYQEIYQLDEDVRESANLVASRRVDLERLSALLPPLRLDVITNNRGRHLTGQEASELRSLGYIAK